MKHKFLTSAGCCEPWEYLTLFAHTFRELTVSGEPVIVYGCGPLTRLLFQRYPAKKLNILGFADGNPLKWGDPFLGFPVFPPDRLNTLPAATVLIISGSSQQDIKTSLENYLKPHFRILPAFPFPYFNDSHLFETVPPLNASGVLQSARHIFCYIEGMTVSPSIVSLSKTFQDRGADLHILADSHYVHKGLAERQFNVENLERLWNAHKENHSKKTSFVSVEGEAIRSFNRSSAASGLMFPQTEQKVFDALLYDRLIFNMLDKTGSTEFIDHILRIRDWEVFLYSGPLKDSWGPTFINAFRDSKRHAVVCPFNYQNNPLIDEYLKSSPLITRLECPGEQWGENKLHHVLTTLGECEMQRPSIPGSAVLIPFSLERRWETREIVREMAIKNQQGKNVDNIIIKCREKMLGQSGDMNEIDFCQEYIAPIFREYPNFTSYIHILDDQLTLPEAVEVSSRIAAPGPGPAVEMAKLLEKPYDILS